MILRPADRIAISPHPSSQATRHRVGSALFAPIDIAALVYFRIVFGAIMLWEVWRYFSHGWIARYYIHPTFHFTYDGFQWIQPWPGIGMYLHFYVLGALAICIMLGLWYRLSTTLFFLGFTYVFLLEQARYLNHFYLICLLSLLMIVIPAHRAVSIDAWWRPSRSSHTAPAWALWLLRAQIGIAYVYGGLAKLNADWLRGEPMRMWLARRTDFPVIGPLFTEEWMVFLFSYGGLLIDLLVVPLLLYRRTRVFAFAAAVVFHLLNAQLLRIGIFPWFMIAATLLFFPPQWPRLGGLWGAAPPPSGPAAAARLSQGQRLTLWLIAAYLTVQLVLPFRHLLYPGNVNWTEEGHRFAWHMKLRSKKGKTRFFALDPASQRTWEINPRDYLTRWQRRKMSIRPGMILQLSHHLAQELREQGYEQIEIRVYATASLNGRAPQLLIDPLVDLAAQPRTWRHKTWIKPLTIPLSNRRPGLKR